MSFSAWARCRLADICESVDYGYTTSASSMPSGPRFLRITDIVKENVDWHKVPFCNAEERELEKYRLHHGDIVIARTGASTGASAYIQEPPKAIFASYLVRLKIGQLADARFVSYYLKSKYFWDYMYGVLGEKSAQPNASAKTLTQALIFLPPLPVQRNIAAVLGSLDDKIELNRRMNETLEEMARALFKSWFVDFDPVRAKMEGRQPVGMDDETAALFPDSFEDSALGEIPKGWSFAPIGEAVRTVGGGTPSTKEPSFWDGGVHCWATPKDLSKLRDPILLDTERKVTDAGLAKISSGLLPVGTVLLSSRAPVGYLAITQVPIAVNQGFIAMICDGPLTNHYVLHWARVAMEQIKGRAGGTTFQEISKTNFRPIQVLVPSREVLAAFEAQVAPLYDKISANLRQSATLASIRDALLPKLLSGEVRVREVEEVVEETLWAP